MLSCAVRSLENIINRTCKLCGPTPGEMLLFSMKGCNSYLPLHVSSGTCGFCPYPFASTGTHVMTQQVSSWRRSNWTLVYFFISFSAGTTQQSRSLPGCMRSAASARKNAGGCVVRRGNEAGITVAVIYVHLSYYGTKPLMISAFMS